MKFFMEAKKVKHEFGAFFDENSKVLILGTIPSPKSREQGFYYAHPRNRFWMVMSDILGENFPETVEERKDLLRRNRIALWDVLESCDIKGASDTSIKNPKVNDMSAIFSKTDIKAVFTTGAKAYQLYEKLCYPQCGIKAIRLPSTSPANCGYEYEKLIKEYKKILGYLGK